MKRDRIYRKIYEDHFGPIPKGHHIHHIDGDFSNNSISNLECLSPSDHAKKHPHMMNFISSSNAACIKGGTSQGKINKDTGHWQKISKYGRTSEISKLKSEKCRKNKTGLFSDAAIENKKNASKILQEECRGIFSKESRDKLKNLGSGFQSYTFEQRSEYSKNWYNHKRKTDPEYLENKNKDFQMHSKISRMFKWEICNIIDGKIYLIINLAEFCRRNDLSIGTLRMTENGSRKHHKGWIAKKLEKITIEDYGLLDETLYYQVECI